MAQTYHQQIWLHMTQTSLLKSNPLMNMFLKREPSQPLPAKKLVKKIKTSDEKFADPLYQILSWRDDIKPHPTPAPGTSLSLQESLITAADPSHWGSNLQGIFINIDWDVTSMQSFKTMTLPHDLLSNGIVFVWGSKTNIGELMDHFEQMGYAYAENFTFVLLSRSKIPQKGEKQLAGNKSLLNFFSKEKASEKIPSVKKAPFHSQNDYEIGHVSNPADIFLNDASEYFAQSQKVLYMFRKINKKQSLELRHQRTSDVYFTIGENRGLDWKSKEIVYRMIETLLIQANYKQHSHLKLLELWGEPGYSRKGWTTVVEKTQSKCTND